MEFTIISIRARHHEQLFHDGLLLLRNVITLVLLFLLTGYGNLTEAKMIYPGRDGHSSLVYNQKTGDLSISLPDSSPSLHSIEITSLARLLQWNPDLERFPFDVGTPRKVLHLDVDGFREFPIPVALRPGLTGEHLADDLSTGTSCFFSCPIDDLVVIPEPSSIQLLSLGVFRTLLKRRRN
ncbi:MAG: hypothetical protein KDB23_20655 [Planctomycetales bacterium]|nr:hypothetical protein [Planctomycetales bacterium]